MKKTALRHGYSLLELAVVLTVLAALAGIGVVATMNSLESTKKATTEKRMDAVEKALMAFRVANARLPCPADLTLTTSSAYFGKEGIQTTFPSTTLAATSHNCITGMGTTTGANFYWDGYNKGAQMAEGAVPTRTLNLPDEYMTDGWGRKFAYAVDAYATVPNAFQTMRPTDMCLLTVEDASGSARAYAAYVLLSYGPNGHGAVLGPSKRLSSGSTNVDELANCHCTNTGATQTNSANTSFVTAKQPGSLP